MIDFLRYRFAVASVSIVIILGAMGTYIYKEKTYGAAFKYSIDFTGGTQVWLRYKDPVASSQIKDILTKEGWSGAITREFGPTEVLVRVSQFVNDAKGLGERIAQALATAMPTNKVEILQSEAVGAGVGAELR